MEFFCCHFGVLFLLGLLLSGSPYAPNLFQDELYFVEILKLEVLCCASFFRSWIHLRNFEAPVEDVVKNVEIGLVSCLADHIFH